MSLLAIAALTVAGPQLTFENGAFVIGELESDRKTVVGLSPPASMMDGGKFKTTVNGVLVSFDQRGLGLQYRGKGGFSGLTYVPTSSRAFAAPEIVQNAALINSGRRTAKASALSGFEIVGNVVYVLARWEEAGGKPWLEAVISVDVSGEDPVTKFVGRLNGLTGAKGLVSDELHAGAAGLAAFIKEGERSGISVVAVPMGEVSHRLFETAPACVFFNGNRIYEIEKSVYGTMTISSVDEISLAKKPIFETRGETKDIDVPGVVIIIEGGVSRLLSLESGAMFDLTPDSGIAATAYGVLVWSPKAAPKSAVIVEPNGWSKVATWTAVKQP